MKGQHNELETFAHEENERFLFMMAGLAEAVGQEVTPLRIKIYAKALEDLKIEEIEKAAWGLIQTRTFNSFPKPAELREAVNGKPEDAALIALEKVERAVREVGGYTSVVFDDPVIHRVIGATAEAGWIGICDMPLEEWKWARKDFMKMYQAFAGRHEMQTPVKLYGRHDMHNTINGHIDSGKAKEYVEYIGDKNKALEWTGNKAKAEVVNIELAQMCLSA